MSESKMDIRNQAKMNTLEAVSTKVAEEGSGDPMAILAIGLQTAMAIGMYEEELDKLTGDIMKLFTALENGEFKDEGGTNLTDTITFKQLKNRLGE